MWGRVGLCWGPLSRETPILAVRMSKVKGLKAWGANSGSTYGLSEHPNSQQFRGLWLRAVPIMENELEHGMETTMVRY